MDAWMDACQFASWLYHAFCANEGDISVLTINSLSFMSSS